MHSGQGIQGRNNFFLIIMFLFFVSTLGFFVLSMGSNSAAPATPANATVACPACNCQCPSCSATTVTDKEEEKPAFVPRPYIKRAQEAMMEKLKRHELKLEWFWPWYLYESTYECAMGEDRIGLPGEGGKWICGVNNLLQKPKCVVYSMGSNGQHDFEDDIMAYTNCEIHTFDMDDYSRVFKGTRVQFHKSKIGDGTDGSQTISYWMNQLGHKYIDVLKIDIEMGEYPAFEHLAKQNPLPWIGQVLIEIHLLGMDFTKLNPQDRYVQIDKNLRLIENLNALGLVQFHREENPYGAACEYAYGNLLPRPQVD